MQDGTHEEFVERAREVEARTFFPQGFEMDGSPYTADEPFLRDAYVYFGRKLVPQGTLDEMFVAGLEHIIAKVEERQKNETKADPNCANWWMWTSLNLLGISKVTIESAVGKVGKGFFTPR